MSHPTLRDLQPEQARHVLGLGGRAASKAANSLAQLVGTPSLALQAEPMWVGGLSDVVGALGGHTAVAVMFKLSGGITGRFWWVAPVADMMAVARHLGAAPSPAADTLDDRTRGLLAEAGNVVSSSFVNVLANALQTSCFPSLPDVRLAPVPLLARMALDATDCVALARLRNESAQVGATLVWSPDPPSLGAMVSRLGA